MKNILVKLTKLGDRLSKFSISDDLGNLLATDISRSQLIEGLLFEVENSVNVIIISSIGKNCTGKSWNIPVTTITKQELADLTFEIKNTSSLWRHLTDITLYNNYYGDINPYIIEYPFSYPYRDEIVQSVEDYSKVYTYLTQVNGIFDDNSKIQIDSGYFNKTVLYNDQQSSGILNLTQKPLNNLKSYLQYPIYNSDSRTILYTKSDNFYKFNTFWSIVKDKSVPLFKLSCESLSIDKEVNQDNMNYLKGYYNKYPLRAKDLKIRYILDNRSDIHIVSQLISQDSQISYK